MSIPDSPKEPGTAKKTLSIAKIVGIVIALLSATTVGLFIEYHLPSTVVARVTGTDIRRVDRENPDSGEVVTADVFFINARTKDGRYMELRNEDDWLYGKINSARIQNIAKDNITEGEGGEATGQKWFVIRYYGWRMQLFSAYPNVIDIDEGEEAPFPVVNSLILVVLFGGIGYVVFMVMRWRKRRRHARLADGTPSGQDG